MQVRGWERGVSAVLLSVKLMEDCARVDGDGAVSAREGRPIDIAIPVW